MMTDVTELRSAAHVPTVWSTHKIPASHRESFQAAQCLGELNALEMGEVQS